MAPDAESPRRWEIAASAAATALAAAAAVSSLDVAGLAVVLERLDTAPAWLRTIADLPQAAWWVLFVAVAALLFWVGLRLSRRWGTVALLMAPAVLLALGYIVPWLLYAPVRALLPGLDG